ncbi:T9SS type A sorting domain-containing protein [bacterium]|nr:T9SS type A sorting domain-containing protein [bacterium]
MRIIILLLLPALLLAEQSPRTIAKLPIYNVPIAGGAERLTVGPASSTRPSLPATLDESFIAGTTWYDYQHNGTAGKMIRVDEAGWVHAVWMKALDAAFASRHVFYNQWNPSEAQFQNAEGLQINSSTRAGYVCQALRPDGFCFPAFHSKTAPDQIFGHSAVAIDFLPQSGAFTTTEPSRVPEGNDELELDWPKIDIDIDGTLHMVSTEQPLTNQLGDPQRIYYARGVPQYDQFGFGEDIDWQAIDGDLDYRLIDTVMVISPDIACSRSSNRVAIAWSQPRERIDSASQYNNDLYLIVSEDGGVNWGPQLNITDFEAPDFDCLSGDTVECDKDTFRVYTDCSIIFDEQDVIHTAFTTGYLYELEGTINIVHSDIWHWDEEHHYFSNIAHGEFDVESSVWIDPGAWQRVVQRPSLAVDPVTGYLYCSFQRYDTLQTSSLGWPQADAYVTVSHDGGLWWSEAVNVTNTDGGQDAPPGESLSERDITVADRITYAVGEGYLHMQYVLDLEAGGSVQEEGAAFDCPVIYERLPISEIPLFPLHNAQYPVLRIDSTGYPPDYFNAAAEPEAGIPSAISLHQNYPNPFNPSTSIQFDLRQQAPVTLRIFDVTGRETATLLCSAMTPAGVHTIEFDGSGLASGVYFCRLEAAGQMETRKMILMK